MIITIDHGNTNCKIALVENGNIERTLSLNEYQSNSELTNLPGAFSSVGEKTVFPDHLIRPLDYREKNKFLNMPVHYSETLGEDRLVYAYHIYNQEHLSESNSKRSLIIDAGTYITIDCVSHSGFEGGFIFPGLQTYLNSFDQGAELPKLQQSLVDEKQVTLPANTQSAITESAKVYLEGIINQVLKKYTPDQIFLTGGSAQKLSQYIPKEMKLSRDEFLIHKALFTFWSNTNPKT
ncbi:MAG: type III pantothenate kinase [Bacteriovoracaceae bacterium]|nr:type III pantothenate kinase [Bacteriovoracaceae bacterium]